VVRAFLLHLPLVRALNGGVRKHPAYPPTYYVAVARHAIRIIDHVCKKMVSPRALVVDDNRDAAESFARLIETLGCQAEFVTDPWLAVEKAEQVRPEIIFLDIAMPGLSGRDLARVLRAKYGWKIRIVAVTAHSGEQDRALSREAGFDAHLAKPVDPELLQSMLLTLFPEMRWQ
jgi:CheY-like chemotaxis protein